MIASVGMKDLAFGFFLLQANTTQSWALFLFWPIMWIALAILTWLYFYRKRHFRGNG